MTNVFVLVISQHCLTCEMTSVANKLSWPLSGKEAKPRGMVAMIIEIVRFIVTYLAGRA